MPLQGKMPRLNPTMIRPGRSPSLRRPLVVGYSRIACELPCSETYLYSPSFQGKKRLRAEKEVTASIGEGTVSAALAAIKAAAALRSAPADGDASDAE